MNGELEHIRVNNYSSAKKRKRKKRKTAGAAGVILIFFLFVATIVLFFIFGKNSEVDITEGADSAYVPSAEKTPSPEEENEHLEAILTPAPVATPIPTPTPTPVPVNNNPANGTVLLRKYSDQACRLTVSNALTTDCCIVAEHLKSETDALIAFVRAGETCDFMIPNGTYNFVAKTGKDYLSTESFFGSETRTIPLAESVVLPWGESYSVSVSDQSKD